MPGYLSVKGFEKFQHYKDRNPPWIKLYNELLDDYAFGLLPDDCKWHLVAIWLLASRYNNQIPADAKWIGQRINATKLVNLVHLVSTGFLIADQDCSELLAACKQLAKPETEGETEGETEKTVMSGSQANADVVQLKTKNQRQKQQAVDVLTFLNQHAGRHFRPTDDTLKPIIARFRDGYTSGEMRAVVVRKCREWKDTEMRTYLRPETLFGPQKFSQYVGEVPPPEPINAA